MPFDIVEAAVQFVFDHSLAAPDSTIVWHSGEPLELPVEWYRQALHRLRGGAPAGTHISHSVQTNGMLVNDEWRSFFRDHSVRVGASLDWAGLAS